MIVKDENFLKRKCSPVKLEEVNELRDKLESELKRSAEMGRPGIGLAANQIGTLKNMAIVRISGPKGLISFDLVNCRIDKKFDQKLFKGEGCLSFPGIELTTKRYHEIHVVDNLVEPHSFIATGMVAIVIQHELDHLNGVTFKERSVSAPVNRLTPPSGNNFFNLFKRKE